MWQFDESAAQFPAPRAEEPENLRREIVEELRDHLTCARRREHMASGEQTEEAVRRRVLDRFGDPAAVARKLWLDWMWERIMNQRILVATCVLMAVISCVALGLAWASLKGQQDMMATWRSASETQMRDQQKLFERLLAQSEKVLTQGAAKSQPSIEWNPVELKFVADKPDGPPLSGVQIQLTNMDRDSGIPSVAGKSDERGIVRFERVHYGNYSLSVTSPTGEYLYTHITQRPAESLSATHVCPSQVSGRTNVIARIEWPKDLAEKPLWFRFRLQGVNRSVADHHWRGPWSLPGDYVESFLVEPGGTVHGVRDYSEARELQTPEWAIISAYTKRQKPTLPMLRWQAFAGDRIRDYPTGIVWPGNEHKIGDLEVLISVPEIATVEDLRSQVQEHSSESRRESAALYRLQRVFVARHVRSADWPQRIEPGTADKPGTLWLTPNTESVEAVRAAVIEAQKAREAAEEARALQEKSRAERLKARTEPTESGVNSAPEAEKAAKKDEADSR
jgi:hypothetical protein